MTSSNNFSGTVQFLDMAESSTSRYKLMVMDTITNEIVPLAMTDMVIYELIHVLSRVL